MTSVTTRVVRLQNRTLERDKHGEKTRQSQPDSPCKAARCKLFTLNGGAMCGPRKMIPVSKCTRCSFTGTGQSQANITSRRTERQNEKKQTRFNGTQHNGRGALKQNIAGCSPMRTTREERPPRSRSATRMANDCPLSALPNCEPTARTIHSL